MFRPNDFNSNIVSRFPVSYIYLHDSITFSDGVAPKLIFTSDNYFPGSEVHGIQLFLDSPSNNSVNLIIGSESNSPLFSTPISSGETIQLIDLLPNSIRLGGRGLILPPSTSLYLSINSQIPNNGTLFIHLIGVGY